MLRVVNFPASPPRLSPGEVHVWYAPLGSDLSSIAGQSIVLYESHPWDGMDLSEDERDRAGRFAFERDRIRYIAARGILRRLLGGYLNIDPSEIRFSYGAFGKPELTGRLAERLKFNLSHAGGWAAYAISRDRDVGIDIEPLMNDVPWQELAPLVFSSNEQVEFGEIPFCEKAAAFLRGWTRKEAYVKGRGEGLSLSLDAFDVPLGEAKAPWRVKSTFTSTAALDEWWLYPIDFADDCVATLAVEGQPVRVEVHRWCCAWLASVQDSLKTKDIPYSADEAPVLFPQSSLRLSPLEAEARRDARDPFSKLGAVQTHTAFN